jgi:CRP/FNR family cyclic AMP-dependent transcriptional regulator
MNHPASERTATTGVLPAAFEQLASAGITRRYPKKTRFISEGDPGTAIYLVLSGTVKVFTSDLDGKEFIFGIYGPGALLGEMALDGQARSASVEAVTDVTCVMVPIDELHKRIASDGVFAMKLILTLIQRSRNTTTSARRLALDSAYERLVALLQSLAVELDGVTVVSELMSQQDIADRIGTSRDMVSKLFKGLTEGCYLTYQKKHITLHKDLPRKW